MREGIGHDRASSAQRVQWLTTGLKSGEVDSCNTFAQ
jgi:predicted metalloprotease